MLIRFYFIYYLLVFFSKDQLAKQPIPQSKAELVGHPLYVLKSKLLKFEGIYPNETPPVGWFRGKKYEFLYIKEIIDL